MRETIMLFFAHFRTGVFCAVSFRLDAAVIRLVILVVISSHFNSVIIASHNLPS